MSFDGDVDGVCCFGTLRLEWPAEAAKPAAADNISIDIILFDFWLLLLLSFNWSVCELDEGGGGGDGLFLTITACVDDVSVANTWYCE